VSWDFLIMRFSRRYDTVADIPDDEKPQMIGPREDVHRAVLTLFPGTDWSDPAWGTWQGEAGSIEFNLGTDDPADSLMLHVRAGPPVVPGIITLCLKNGWQGIDCWSGELLERSDDPTRGLNAWAEYRSRILNQDRLDEP
jgi:hypothetical protein